MLSDMIELKNYEKASEIIKDSIIRTPLIHSPSLSRQFGGSIFLKLENLQKTGSFKIRGASYKLLIRKNEIGLGGVVAASAGNHAQGVALAAAKAGIRATIIMPEWVSISKQEATRNYKANIHIEGESVDACIEIAKQLVQKGKYFIHPFDDIDIITGNGTIALEILKDLSDADTIIVPVGGGGLISGIAAAAKSVKKNVRIIGVQTDACPSAYESLKQGKLHKVSSKPSIADGIAIKQTGTINFEYIRNLVDDIVLVKEKYISSAVLSLLERKKILAEGAGAVSLAALLSGSVKVREGEKVVLVISGGNVDSPLLGRIINQGLAKNGRIMRFLVKLRDTPGSLAKLLDLIAGLKANVLDVHHERYIKKAPLFVSYVEIEIETRGPSHIREIRKRLKKEGYHLVIRD